MTGDRSVGGAVGSLNGIVVEGIARAASSAMSTRSRERDLSLRDLSLFLLQPRDHLCRVERNLSRRGRLPGNVDSFSVMSTLSISNSYAAILPQASPPPSGGLFGNLWGHNQLAVTLTNVLVFEQIPGSDQCLYGASFQPTISGTGLFWDSDLCIGTDPAGSGIGGASLTDESIFSAAGYQFTDTVAGAPWKMGAQPPVLAWEP